jgi:D-cysteine desulfhydrase
MFPELLEALPAIWLGAPPTPVRRLEGLGGDVWLKDEGAYGDGGWGGNKVRKLEWLIPEAHRRQKETIVTVGGLGTNWGLACALYGSEHGLETVLALIDQPVDEHVEAQQERLRASGAEIHLTGTKTRTVVSVPWLLASHRKSWFLPAGGSSPVGALGAVEIALELAVQVEAGEIPEPSYVVTAVGSGGTAAGLVLGLELAGLGTKVLGVVVNDTLDLGSKALLRLTRKSARLLSDRGADLPELDLSGRNLVVVEDQIGDGYGHKTRAGTRAAGRASKKADLDLDPVYTAKAMAGLLELVEGGGRAEGPIVFLDTDGPRP